MALQNTTTFDGLFLLAYLVGGLAIGKRGSPLNIEGVRRKSDPSVNLGECKYFLQPWQLWPLPWDATTAARPFLSK